PLVVCPETKHGESDEKVKLVTLNVPSPFVSNAVVNVNAEVPSPFVRMALQFPFTVTGFEPFPLPHPASARLTINKSAIENFLIECVSFKLTSKKDKKRRASAARERRTEKWRQNSGARPRTHRR